MQVESWFAGSERTLEGLADKARRERYRLEREGLDLLFEAVESLEGEDRNKCIELDTDAYDYPSRLFQELPLSGRYLVKFECTDGTSGCGWARRFHDSARFSIEPWGFTDWKRETTIVVRRPYEWNGMSQPSIEIETRRKAIKSFYPFGNGSMGEDWDNVNTLDVLRLLNWVVNQRLKDQKEEVAAELTSQP